MPDMAVRTAFTATDRISPAFNRMGKGADIFGRHAKTSFKSASDGARGFGNIIKGILGADIIKTGFLRLKSEVASFITEAAKIEDARASFTPLMGSVERANQLVAALNQTSATTPFQFEDISKAAKQLLPTMNGDIEKTISTFRMLGDTAGGNAQKLDSITRGFTKSMLKGKVDLESLNMISEAGVPIFDQLSKKLGVSSAEMFKLVSAGKVTTDQLTSTFQTMTSEGGIFFNGMEIASETFSGKMSTLADNIALTKAAIGAQLLPVIKNLVNLAISATGKIQNWVNTNQELINTRLGQFIDTATSAFQTLKPYLAFAFKVFVGLVKVGLTLISWIKPLKPFIIGIGIAWGIWAASTAILTAQLGFAAAAQWALNIAMTANPIGLIIVGIGLLIGSLIFLGKVIYDNRVRIVDFFKKFGGIILALTGPFGMVINVIIGLATRWKEVKSAFKAGGIIGAVKQIGVIILQSLIKPVQMLLGLIAKIPGMGGIASGISGALGNIGGTAQAPAQAPNNAEVQARYAGNNTQVNVYGQQPGTRAEVTPRRGASVNMEMVGANP